MPSFVCEKRRRRKKRGRDKSRGRRRKRKKSIKEWRNMFGRKEREFCGESWNLEILAMAKVLSLVLTDTGPRNSPESLSWMRLQTLCNFL